MHALRIDDELWSAALVKAKSEGRSLTAVINDALAGYVAGPRPDAALASGGAADEIESKPRLSRKPVTGRRAVAVVTGNCPHPPGRVHKGLCGACGTGGLS